MSAFLRNSFFVIAASILSTTVSAQNPLGWLVDKLPLVGDKKAADETPPPPKDLPEAIAPIALSKGVPYRFAVRDTSPAMDFSEGKSHYRRIDLLRALPFAALRIETITQGSGKSKSVLKPIVYVLDDAEKPRDSVKVDKLALDIRPLQATRLVSCVKLKNVQHFALASVADDKNSAFKGAARDKVDAPTKGGFYYATDGMQAAIAYARFGEVELTINELASEKDDCQ